MARYPRKPENRGLPSRWTYQHGAYYYRVPGGLEDQWEGKKMYRLGSNLSESYKHWAERIEVPAHAKTIGALLDRYLLEVVPTKRPKTQSNYQHSAKRLRKPFGGMPLTGLKPRFVYGYVDKSKSKISAHRDIEVLSHAFTKAVEWGYIDKHPFKGEVRLEGERPRDRLVEDWEIIEFLSLKPRRKAGSALAIQAYVRIKLLTGISQSDLLRLQPARFTSEGILVQRHKTATSTGKRTLYEWTPDLKAAVDMALAARPVDIAPWLFCTREGAGYFDESKGEASGWKSMWQRYMARALKETALTERFTEHDLRAKVATDASSLERARALLAHADSRLTARVYRRKPERVQPLR
jgi:integrase